VVLILIHQTAGVVRQARDIQQRMGQRIELFIIQCRCFMPPAQPHLPENLHAQIVASPARNA
jgi:hypothetical protein